MTKRQKLGSERAMTKSDGRGLQSHGSLDADIIIANAPDPVFVSALEGKIVQANDAVSQLLGLPFNSSASFNPNSVTGYGTSTMTVSTNASTSTGTFTLRIRATS